MARDLRLETVCFAPGLLKNLPTVTERQFSLLGFVQSVGRAAALFAKVW